MSTDLRLGREPYTLYPTRVADWPMHDLDCACVRCQEMDTRLAAMFEMADLDAVEPAEYDLTDPVGYANYVTSRDRDDAANCPQASTTYTIYAGDGGVTVAAWTNDNRGDGTCSECASWELRFASILKALEYTGRSRESGQSRVDVFVNGQEV